MPTKDPKKTKIVCTIGPASESKSILEKLFRGGMDAVRLNFSHGTYEEHKRKLYRVRQVSEKLDREVAVIQDLGGPKIRTGDLPAEGLWVKHGQEIVLVPGRPRQGNEVPISYSGLAKDVQKGDAILLSDGGIELRVSRVEDNKVVSKVVAGGVIESRKGVNVPTRGLSVSGLTRKDKKDLEFAIAEDVDFIALSFVRSAEDVQRLKRLLKKRGRDIPVIAKIEKPQALDHIDAIIEEADGLMVARGDLGVEIPLEEVPVVQKMLIRKANTVGKPVITATQMLRSMVDQPRPTRAEVTDVANAVWDGTDAVMLSEETAVGKHPAKAVRMMERICRNVEAHMAEGSPLRKAFPAREPVPDAISYSVYAMSEELSPRAIFTPTRTGATARRISRYRPDPLIVTFTPSLQTQRRLCLTWGVVPFLIPELTEKEDVTEHALALAGKCLPVKRGELIIITAGTSSSDPGTTNTLRLEKYHPPQSKGSAVKS
ncbi:MAG: pyruvate kinase [bacterium]